MARIAVVYHTRFGHTRAVAECVARGAARAPGAAVDLVPVEDLPAPGPDRAEAGRWGVLDAADAIIFGCPTYMGSVSAGFKQFMEHTSSRWARQAWKDKLAGGFTNSGSASGDKLNTLTDLAVFAAQHAMLWVSHGLLPDRAAADPEGLNRLGSYLGAMAQSDQAPPDVTPPPGDRRSAELFGERVAALADRWVRGPGAAAPRGAVT
jgi:multimeric flavodoxin WrbA